MSLKVAINGTGRIGLCTARIIGERKDIELTSMNTTADIDTLLHLIKYDSVHGFYDAKKVDKDTLSIGNSKAVKIISNRDIAQLNFMDASMVIECTGKFNSFDKASQHIKGNVKKVIISAPADNTKMLVYGVNLASYKNEAVVSNASCTTNALAPIVKILNSNFGIENGLMTTIHSYTNDQNVLDVKHQDRRRARAAALNMIPTSTGAAKAIGEVIPELNGKLNGLAIRVPTPNVSLIDLSVNLINKATVDEVNLAFLNASQAELKGLIEVDKDFRVSSDFIGSKLSCSIISDKTMVIGNNLKVLAWYDNEIGYSNRLVDTALFVGKFSN